MNASVPGGDTQPWYRQFWPWFLILLPATVVVASLYTMYLASTGSDDLVVDDYYKNGLAINRQLEKLERSAELGITARLTFTHDEVVAGLAGPVEAGELWLHLSHPLEADRDFSVNLRRTAPGEYRGQLAEAIAPRWHWILELQGDQGWRLDGSVSGDDIGDADGE